MLAITSITEDSRILLSTLGTLDADGTMDGESLQRGALRIVATRGTAYSHPTCTTASVQKELDVGAGNLSEFSESPPRVPWKASNTCHTPSPNSDANLNSTTATPFRSELEEELAKLKEEDDLLESLRCEIHAVMPHGARNQAIQIYGRFSNAFDGQKQDRLSHEPVGVGRKSGNADAKKSRL